MVCPLRNLAPGKHCCGVFIDADDDVAESSEDDSNGGGLFAVPG